VHDKIKQTKQPVTGTGTHLHYMKHRHTYSESKRLYLHILDPCMQTT